MTRTAPADEAKQKLQTRYVEVARRLIEKHGIAPIHEGLGITRSTLEHRIQNPSAVRREHVLALQKLREKL